VTAVHQFVPALLPRDATGEHTLALRDALRDAGWASDIYVEAAHDDLWPEARYFEEYAGRARPGDVLLYQVATGSPVAEFLLGRPEPLVLYYHNITPASFYETWEPSTASKVGEARAQLAALVPRAALCMAASAYSAAELEGLGCARPAVAPVLVDPARFAPEPDPAEAARLAEGHGPGAVVLFVGRLSPNKAQHRLVETLWWLRRAHDPDARLRLVGPAVTPAYAEAVLAFAGELGLAEAVEHGEDLTPAQLAAWYADADVFVCQSEHEGFCIPLLEAMHFGVPIVATPAGAVPETLGDGGLLVGSDRPADVAAVVSRVAADPVLAGALAGAGTARLRTFAPPVVRRRHVELLAGVVTGPKVAA
jgi:glycosyltransferase involved in cell wall biosynthesis